MILNHYELLKIMNGGLFEFATSSHTRYPDLTNWSNTVLLYDKYAVFSEALANRWQQFASAWTLSKKTDFQLGKCQSDALDRLRISLLAHLFYLDFVMTCHEHACIMPRAHVVFLEMQKENFNRQQVWVYIPWCERWTSQQASQAHRLLEKVNLYLGLGLKKNYVFCHVQSTYICEDIITSSFLFDHIWAYQVIECWNYKPWLL